MTETTRTSIAPAIGAVAAWGAGLIQIALGADALTGDLAARGAGLVLVTLGAGSVFWGAMVLVRGHVVVPRTGIAGALAGIAALTAVLWAQPGRASVIAAAAASALLIAVALTCGLRLRAGDDRTDAGAPRVSALIAAAVVVAAIVTPALGTTEGARFAPDHGSHELVDPGHH
ncbi:hypothetical protein [Microbacterium yannicii]|uniref:hypothetical protein n=1 Tax=Microbacterium yannicii TaxID=671622 RepID=UPI0002D6A626|nr:hypothetical protein [Microbacterium yannicii]